MLFLIKVIGNYKFNADKSQMRCAYSCVAIGHKTHDLLQARCHPTR